MNPGEVAFTSRQASELVTAILGRGEIPLKFAYLSKEGVSGWSDVAATRSTDSVRGINRVEANLLISKIDSFLLSCGEFELLNIVDIGCGEGSPVLPLLQALRERSARFRYVPVDISEQMLESASNTIRRHFPSSEIRPVPLDFEYGNFAELTHDLRTPRSKNLLLFLGSTLGNQQDRHRVLTNLRDSMTSADYLIVGVELVNLARLPKLLAHYQGPIVEQFVFSGASAVGLTREHGELNVRFNADLHQVEVGFTLAASQTLTVGSESFKLEGGEQLLLARSHKFSEWVFVKVLQEVGFRIELLTTSAEKGYSLVMCQPSRFAY
jgi:uncharacterized SAM-dependent methyltransferase